MQKTIATLFLVAGSICLRAQMEQIPVKVYTEDIKINALTQQNEMPNSIYFAPIHSQSTDTLKIAGKKIKEEIVKIYFYDASTLAYLGEEVLFTVPDNTWHLTLESLPNGDVVLLYLVTTPEKKTAVNMRVCSEYGVLRAEQDDVDVFWFKDWYHAAYAPMQASIMPSESGGGFFLVTSDTEFDCLHTEIATKRYEYTIHAYDENYELVGTYVDKGHFNDNDRLELMSFHPIGSVGLFALENEEGILYLHEIIFSDGEGVYRKHKIVSEEGEFLNFGTGAKGDKFYAGGVVGYFDNDKDKTPYAKRVYSIEVDADGEYLLNYYEPNAELAGFLKSDDEGAISGFYPYLVAVTDSHKLVYEYCGRYIIDKAKAREMGLTGDMNRFRMDFFFVADSLGSTQTYYANRCEFDPVVKQADRLTIYNPHSDEVVSLGYDLNQQIWDKRGGDLANSFKSSEFELEIVRMNLREEEIDEDDFILKEPQTIVGYKSKLELSLKVDYQTELQALNRTTYVAIDWKTTYRYNRRFAIGFQLLKIE